MNNPSPISSIRQEFSFLWEARLSFVNVAIYKSNYGPIFSIVPRGITMYAHEQSIELGIIEASVDRADFAERVRRGYFSFFAQMHARLSRYYGRTRRDVSVAHMTRPCSAATKKNRHDDLEAMSSWSYLMM
ncbi:MAG: hypothetical protein QM784_39430 [Polyangiaceae bacterium]